MIAMCNPNGAGRVLNYQCIDLAYKAGNRFVMSKSLDTSSPLLKLHSCLHETAHWLKPRTDFKLLLNLRHIQKNSLFSSRKIMQIHKYPILKKKIMISKKSKISLK